MKRHALKSGTVSRARSLRRSSTEAEAKLWYALRHRFADAKFRRQVPLGPYFADFASHAAKLVVEVDGSQHIEAAAADAERTSFLNSEGYRVLRFWNNQVLTELDLVLSAIHAALPSPLVGEGGAERRMRGAQHGCAPASGRNPSPQPSPTRGEGKSVNLSAGVR